LTDAIIWLEFPDLSYHVDTAVPLEGGVPVFNGSEPSTQMINPAIVVGKGAHAAGYVDFELLYIVAN
jgi:hypothetical protein